MSARPRAPCRCDRPPTRVAPGPCGAPWPGPSGRAASPSGSGRASALPARGREATVGCLLSWRLEPQVLVRGRVREALDVIHARFLDPRTDAPEEGQLVNRHVHRAIVHDLLDLVQQALALLPVQLARLALEEGLDLRDLAGRVDAALGRVHLDAGRRIAGGCAQAHDHAPQLVLAP